MPNDKNAFKAGLFILTALGLGIGILFAIRGTGALFHPMRSLTATFDLSENVGGLKAGDSVRIGGVDQGRVQQIEFLEPGEGRPAPQFRVTFTLPSAYDVRRDAVVQVEQGLTGTSNLNISSFGAAAPIADGEVLDGRGAALAMLLESAPRAVEKFDGVLVEARGAVTDVRQQIPSVVKRYDNVMTRADETLTHARDLLGDTKSDIRSSFANINSATGTLKEKLPSTFQKAEQFLETTTKTIDGAKGTLDDIRLAAANIKDGTGEAKSLLVRNRSKIDHMIASLRNTSTNLESASAEIRRSPWRLLYQPKADELSNLNIYDSTREFAGAATNLNDAASAVRDALADPSITTQQLQELVNSLDASFAKYKEVETKLWNAVK